MAEAELFIRQDSIPVDRFVNEAAFHIFHKDSVNTGLLPIGHYVLISTSADRVIASLEERSGLIVYPVNNGSNIQIDIRNQDGLYVNDAEVWINGKKAVYQPEANNYLARQRKIKDGLVKIITPRDSCLLKQEPYGYTASPIGPCKKTSICFLEYYSKGKQYQQLLGRVQPASPGSYIYTFPLSDTLPSDTRYTTQFRNEKESRY